MRREAVVGIAVAIFILGSIVFTMINNSGDNISKAVQTQTPTIRADLDAEPASTNTPTDIGSDPVPTEEPRIPMPPVLENDEPSRVPVPPVLENNEPPQILKPPAEPAVTISEMREYMLGLINKERINAGLNPVVLGDNAAAQQHAEDMLENCFSGHWGSDGLKPYMRYTLAGGEQYESENVSGLDYCTKPSDGYAKISHKKSILNSMEGFMDSPGHRDNILDPHHKKVNIGLAWDDYNFQKVQHFEYGFVSKYNRPPTISDDGMLSFTIGAAPGARFQNDMAVSVYYDKTPHELSRGQLASTYCYSSGEKEVASIVEPLQSGYYYAEHTYEQEYSSCTNPYLVPSYTKAPSSNKEAHEFHDKAKRDYQGPTGTYSVPWIAAEEWRAAPHSFSISADISNVLESNGAGVYTIIVGSFVGNEYIPVSIYSIFNENPVQYEAKMQAPVGTDKYRSGSGMDAGIVEEQIQRLVSGERIDHDVIPLAKIVSLDKHAILNSAYMYDSRHSIHYDYEVGVQCDAGHAGGITSSSHAYTSYENEADLAAGIVGAWMNSEDDWEKILNSAYRTTGIGVALAPDERTYVTQYFC